MKSPSGSLLQWPAHTQTQMPSRSWGNRWNSEPFRMRACTQSSAWTKGGAGTTFQFCTSDGLIGVWCTHYLWCYPSGFIDLNEPLGSFTTWFMLHFFGACSKKDWYRIESGAWCKHQVVCGAWCMAQNNGSEFHLMKDHIHIHPNVTYTDIKCGLKAFSKWSLVKFEVGQSWDEMGDLSADIWVIQSSEISQR